MKSGAMVLVLVGLVLASCGPVESTAVINDARVALAGARAADGERYAPYEYESAEQYLEKAREERGYADFQVAITYARKAREMARQAQAKAQKAVRDVGEDASQGSVEPMEDQAPETPKIEEITPEP